MVIIGVLIFCLICAIIGASLAGEKDRKAAGFWLGLFFGPLGIIMALLLPPKEILVSSGIALKPSEKTYSDCHSAHKADTSPAQRISLSTTESDVTNEIMRIEIAMEKYGVSLYGCYGYENDPINFPFLIDAMKASVSPKNYSNAVDWAQAASASVVLKCIAEIETWTSPLNPEKLSKVIPLLSNESVDEHMARTAEISNILMQVASSSD